MTDVFMSEGGSKYPALKFENVNDTHTGRVVEVKKLEDRDPDGNVKTWPNGDTRFVFVFTVENNGEFGNIWARGNMVKAIREAAQAAGLSTMIGANLTVKYSGDGEKKKGFNAPKLYKAKVEAPKPQDASVELW
jgi:hypothetical protein